MCSFLKRKILWSLNILWKFWFGWFQWEKTKNSHFYDIFWSNIVFEIISQNCFISFSWYFACEVSDNYKLKTDICLRKFSFDPKRFPWVIHLLFFFWIFKLTCFLLVLLVLLVIWLEKIVASYPDSFPSPLVPSHPIPKCFQ